MLESLELRVNEKQAWRAFAPDEGLLSGFIRKVEIPTGGLSPLMWCKSLGAEKQ